MTTPPCCNNSLLPACERRDSRLPACGAAPADARLGPSAALAATRARVERAAAAGAAKRAKAHGPPSVPAAATAAAALVRSWSLCEDSDATGASLVGVPTAAAEAAAAAVAASSAAAAVAAAAPAALAGGTPLRPLRPLGICCFGTAAFRALAGSCLRPGGADVVLEIGSSYGVCTAQIAAALGDGTSDGMKSGARRVVGVDTSRELVAAAAARFPALRFERADALATPHAVVAIAERLLREEEEEEEEGGGGGGGAAAELVVFVDIGGNRELEALVALLPWVATGLPRVPRLIVVKSEALCKAGRAAGGLDWGALREAAGAAIAARRGGAARREEGRAAAMPHPWRAPLRRNAAGVPICRFHNYRRPSPTWEGPACKEGDECELDHEHCHWCGVAGHIALHCDSDSGGPLIGTRGR